MKNNYNQTMAKVSSDWDIYVQRETAKTPQEIFENSYQNAIAKEWLFFFENSFEDYADNEKATATLLSYDNIFDELIEAAAWVESLEFSD